MGLRFRSSFKLFPGVRLNLSGHGVSATIGVSGASFNVGPRGVRARVGIPGSGISYHEQILKFGEQPSYWEPPSPSLPRPDGSYEIPSGPVLPAMRPISSAPLARLTSPALVPAKAMLTDARRQSTEIAGNLNAAERRLSTCEVELHKKRRSLFRRFMKKRIAELEGHREERRSEVEELRAWQQATVVDLLFEISNEDLARYEDVVRAYERLRSSERVWDITADRNTNRVAERTVAVRAVDRKPVSLTYSRSALVRSDIAALRFVNANGEDINVYPGVAILERSNGEFALIDIRELQVAFEPITFIEREVVPRDARVAGHTWAKANKDGTPDRRFRDNYQIPVVIYGIVTFKSGTGLNEEYQFSDAEAAAKFTDALHVFQSSLRSFTERQLQSVSME